jgi:hypothetical protein
LKAAWIEILIIDLIWKQCQQPKETCANCIVSVGCPFHPDFNAARERSLQANGQLLNINLIQNPAVKKLAERYLQCVNDFRQLHWQVCIHARPRCRYGKHRFSNSIPSIWR